MRVTFFCFAKRKSPKKRRPPVCDPCASLRGTPASGRLRGAPWNSLCAAARRSDIHGESEHEARALRRACHPATAPPQAQPAGVDSRTSNSRTTIRAIPALGRACAARGACARDPGPSAAMARVDVLSLVPLWMRRGAQGLADQGSRVSERRAAARVERDPAKPEHRRLPRSEAQGTQTVGSPFFWVLFFGEAKKSASPAGRLPASALHQGMPLIRQTALCTEGECFKKHSCQRISH